jgi:hypothetical protein
MQIEHTRLLPASKLVEKFVARMIIPDDVNQCWEWQGCKDKDGYGVSTHEAKKIPAHRRMFLFANGHLVKNLIICHSCDNPSCCNPAHLWAGTTQDNIRDKVAKGRQPRGDKNGARTKPESRRRGDSHHCTKLKDCDVPIVFKLREQGLSMSKIGKLVGLSSATVYKIFRKENRKHLYSNDTTSRLHENGGVNGKAFPRRYKLEVLQGWLW